MEIIEDNCVGCPPELGCLGNSCPYRSVRVFICDTCQEENAEYKMDGSDFCESCANQYLNDLFNDLTVAEKAELLEIELKELNRM